MAKKLLLSALFAFAITIVASAQPSFDPLNPNAEGIPVDGGIGFLLAGGAAYGLKKLKAKKALAKAAE
jgi:hypothetical protein